LVVDSRDFAVGVEAESVLDGCVGVTAAVAGGWLDDWDVFEGIVG